MKKIALLLSVLILFCSCLCACSVDDNDYSDGDGNSELISMENKKISNDDIEFKVVSIDEEKEQNKVKTYKSVYEAADFSVKLEKVKTSGNIYVTDDKLSPKYPEKTLLPEYDIEALKSIMAEAYFAKTNTILDETIMFVSQPEFSVKSFTGKLVVTYYIYFEPLVDEFGVTCYKSAKRLRLTGDLYTYSVQ